MNTIISEHVLKAIARHGEIAFPNECCGFLYGKDGEERSITDFSEVINSKDGDQSRRFEISPIDFMKAERKALSLDLDLLGVYHSHPNHPAIASEHDLKSALPFFSYVIVSIKEGKYDHVLSWRLKDDERIFLEEKLN